MGHEVAVSWLVVCALGGFGGALNAVLSDHTRLWPSMITLSPGGTRVVRIGVLGNIAAGAVVALVLSWAAEAAGMRVQARSEIGVLLLGSCTLFVAFVSARWITNEVDKAVLRKAVFKAASAPAAHPDTMGQLEYAPPDTLYVLVDRMMPRRAGHR